MRHPVTTTDAFSLCLLKRVRQGDGVSAGERKAMGKFRATILDSRQLRMPVVLDHESFEAALLWLIMQIMEGRALHSVNGTKQDDFRIRELFTWTYRLAQKKKPFVLAECPEVSTWRVSVTEGEAWSEVAAGRVLENPLSGRHALEDRYPALDDRFAGVAVVPPVQTWPINGGAA